MGTLQVAYENKRKEAEMRIINLNNTLLLERIEKLEKYDYMYFSKRENSIPFNPEFLQNKNLNAEFNPRENPITFEKPTSIDLTINEPHITDSNRELYTPMNKEDEKLIENYRNLAYKLYLTKNPENWHWMTSLGAKQKYSALVKNELDRYLHLYFYNYMKENNTLKQTLKENKATAMILTEEFGEKYEKIKNSNKKFNDMAFNHLNEKGIGFDNLIGNSSNKDSFENVMDSLFGEYLRNKKEGLQLTKVKLQEQKEKFASMENVPRMNQYELLQKNQQEYFEMKMGNKNDSRMKFDINTYLKINNSFKEYPTFYFNDVTDIVSLDNATSQALYGNYASIPKHLVEQTEIETNNFHFNGKHLFDKTEEEWFEDQMEIILIEFFQYRSQVEKSLTRDELYALDKDLIKDFTLENMIDNVKKNLNHEILIINLLNQILEHERNSSSDQKRQKIKFPNKQFEFNRNMKDENAYYQYLAFMGKTNYEADKNIEESKRNKKSKEEPLNPLKDEASYEFFYAKDLLFNQVYKNRKENSDEFMNRLKSKQFYNMNNSYYKYPNTGKEKIGYVKDIKESIEENPNKCNFSLIF
jgi:hypothetical protein